MVQRPSFVPRSQVLQMLWVDPLAGLSAFVLVSNPLFTWKPDSNCFYQTCIDHVPPLLETLQQLPTVFEV